MCVFYHASPEVYNVGQMISVENFQGETTRDHARKVRRVIGTGTLVHSFVSMNLSL